jgi:hypothetical protein
LNNIPITQSLQAFAKHSTHSALEALTFHSLHTRFAHQLIAVALVEQNSIGHTQIIISQDFKRIVEGLLRWVVILLPSKKTSRNSTFRAKALREELVVVRS